ncbi:polymorphic toxin-type HINT domain-containing protein [Paenibacillus flagellatus]|uniref:F5/8 type C domain-containing protein n=1 Tax=Paenibacillus flagellatus TaxID=2211139 RepID=A0A2V5KDL9_9BACL|nr:polymorphic toxin-type HINT domain-containing protein [Paenibacillus flagellatus]PYI56314.1 hypothetical protein DLM86_04860 [Paenibacillus flagellatus]
MKRTKPWISILLITVMILSGFPSVNVAMADEASDQTIVHSVPDYSEHVDAEPPAPPEELVLQTQSSSSDALVEKNGFSLMAATDISGWSKQMNGIAMPQVINESGKDQYADRYRSQEAVDRQSGSLSINVTDLVLPGRDGLDFALSRHYNSNQAQMGEMRSVFTEVSSGWNYYKDYNYWQYVFEGYTSNGSGPYTSYSSLYKTYEEAETACSSYANSTTYAQKVCRVQPRNETYRKFFSWSNVAEKTSYLRSRYDLGAGWALGLPSLQIVKSPPDDGSEIHFHDGTGASYYVSFTYNPEDSNLVGYPRDDVKFYMDNGTYSNGQKSSSYVFSSHDLRKTYFADDGRLLGIKDRFGNEIRFSHVVRTVNGVEYAYVQQITDSIGRIIQLTYDNAIDNPAATEDNVTVTVTYPGEPGKQTVVKYTKKRHIVDGRYEPYLYAVTKAPNTSDQTTTYYEYESVAQRFYFYMYNPTASVYTQLLKRIIYPHSVSNYEYETSSRKLGAYGSMDAFRVKDRSDMNRVGTAVPAFSKPNLALGKPVQVSSYYVDTGGDDTSPDNYIYYYGSNVVDGKSLTSWIPNGGDANPWLYVDLGSVQSFNQVVIRWKNRNPYAQYSIQVSNDATTWSDLYVVNIGSGIAEDIRNLNGNARYVRILNGSNLIELEIYQHPGMNQVGYAYLGDYTDNRTGFPHHATVVTTQDRVQSTITFNEQGQESSIVTLSADGREIRTQENELFHDTYKYKPTRTRFTDQVGPNTQRLYVSRTYNSWGGLASETQPLNWADFNNEATKAEYTTKYEYDASFHFPSKTERKQNANTIQTETIDYHYDPLVPALYGRLKKTVNANGESVEYTYELTDGKVSKAIAIQTLEDGKVARTETEYGPAGVYAFPTKVKQFYTDENNQPQIMETSRTYEVLTGLLMSETAPGGRITTFGYDKLGRPTSVIQPSYTGLNGVIYDVEERTEYAPNQSSAAFDSTNSNVQTLKVKTYTSVRNRSTNSVTPYNVRESFYDGTGNLILRQFHDSQRGHWIPEVQLHYDGMSRPIYAIDAENNVQTMAYDIWGRNSQVTDTHGNIYKSVHDLIQRTTTSYMVTPENAANPDDSVKWNVLEKQFDHLGRPLSYTAYPNWPDRINKVQGFYAYDYVGNVIRSTDPKGYVTNYQYDKLNRLTKITDPLQQATDYSYTALGQIKETKQVDGQTFTTTKTYDELGRIRQTINPAGQSDQWNYNAVGDLSSKRDLNQNSFQYIYDELHRLVASNLGTTSFKTYYEANPFGPVRKEEWNGSSAIRSAAYTYTSNGQLASKVVTSDGLPLSMSNTFDRAGKPTGVTDGFAFTTAYAYDRGRVDKVQTNGAASAPGTDDSQYAKYEYNPNGTLKTITYPRLADGTYLKAQYEYDKMNRLTKVTNVKGTQPISTYQYGYDANSNIVSVTDAAGTTGYEYDKLNRLTKTTRPDGQIVTYTYDGRGNRKTNVGDSLIIREANYTFNPWNELTGVASGGETTEYQYSPETEGLRIKKTSSTGTVRYTYNGKGQVIAESDANNNVTAQYVWGPDRLLMKKDAATGQSYYYLQNGHGDVVQLVSTAGAVVNNYRYDEWGNVLSETESVPNVFKYAGEQYDAEVGLYYLRARYYDPGVGRFISKDAYEGDIANPLTLNLYAYVHNNPLIYIDPTGHWCTSADGLYSHRGDCNYGSNGNYESFWDGHDYDHNGDWEIENGVPVRQYFYEGNVVNKIGDWFKDFGKLEREDIEHLEYVGAQLGGLPYDVPDENVYPVIRGPRASSCNCFTSGTKVLTDEGEKNIEDIEVGDKVLAKDENNPSGELAYKEVTALYRNQRDDIIKLHVGEQIIETTDNHPFWVEGKGWVFAGELQVGDKLQKADESNLTIDKVEFIKLDKPVTVYNFTVADFHTYYVTDIGIWVHNTKCSNNNLSSPNPLPKTIRDQYEEIRLGGGTPRIDPVTGKQKVFNANELKNISGGGTNVWSGSLEYDVPGTSHRILRRPDGKLGYVLNHDYSQPKLFPGPWYPEGGK